MVLWKLLLAHVMTDFVFQNSYMARHKTNLKINLEHCIIFIIISTILFINELSLNILIIIFVVAIFHGIIDYFKALVEERIDDERYNSLIFVIDQVMHLIAITVVLLLSTQDFLNLFMSNVDKIIGSRNWIKLFLFLIIITFGGRHFTAKICKGFQPDENETDSLQNAGSYIGILERIIVSAAILIGRFEIIGFLIAAKSIIRHHRNGNEKQFSEYFLIGTLTSFL